MIFIQETRVQLTIYYIPLLEWLMFGGVAIVTGYLLFQSSATAQFTCEREASNNGLCEISGHLFSHKTFPLILLTAADVESITKTNKGSTYYVYRVVLVTGQESVPLTERYEKNKVKIDAIASEINDFLKNPEQKSLSLTQGADKFEVLFFLLFFVGSGIWLIRTKIWKVSFHRLLKRAEIEQWSLFGAKFTSSLKFNEIISVRLDTTVATSFLANLLKRQQESHDIVVITQAGHSVSFFPATTNYFFKKRYETVIHRINGFLQLF